MNGHFNKNGHKRWVEDGWTLSRHSRTLEKIGHATVTRRSRSRLQIIRKTVYNLNTVFLMIWKRDRDYRVTDALPSRDQFFLASSNFG